VIIFITGCSAIKQRSNLKYASSEELKGDALLEAVRNQNLTNSSFFIQKAEIDISSEKENQKLIASIKYEFPDKYLVSLKSRTGIEAARIFISKDTVLINDRIKRILYFGTPEYLKKKFGVPPNVLPVVLGDFMYDNKNSSKEQYCIDGKIGFDYDTKGIKYRYIVDCSKLKTVTITRESDSGNNLMEIAYNHFVNIFNGLTPSGIRISYGNSIIGIKLGKIESPWNGSIEFIPGKKYDLIELL
jgi:hypothetical protein